MELNGLAAVVTGSTGLGAQTARALRERGMRVAVLDTGPDPGPVWAGDIGATYLRVDFRHEAALAEALAAAHERNGVARVLVNCTTVAAASLLVAPDGTPHRLDAFRAALDDNLVSTFGVAAAFAAALVAVDPIGEERGVIINTASIAATDGLPGQSAYAAAKAGVIALTLPLARELAPQRIRVMTISPGLFETAATLGLPREMREAIEARVPHPSRAGRLEEFARLVVEIAENPMLNGSVIRLDGAVRLGPN